MPSDDYCNAVQNEITIFTVNNITGDDVRDVKLSFACGRYSCEIGKSDWLSFGAASGIAKRLPYCVYGVIKGARQGFEDAQSFIQTDVDGRSYILLMNPVKELNYRVVKHMLSNPTAVQELESNEKASIFIKGIGNGFEGFAVYPREAEFQLRLPDKDASYEVNVYLADGENIIAGYIGNWSVSRDVLGNANEIIFHVVEHEALSEDERTLFIASLSSYSKNVPKPEIIQNQ